MATLITRSEVIERSKTLPVFPALLNQIMATIDDVDSNLNVLVSYIERDPLIAARVLSLANIAAQKRQFSEICNLHTAISQIGVGRVREIALFSSTAKFIHGFSTKSIPATFWAHSVGVGICSEELAHFSDTPNLANAALIAGLLHDIGQLWLFSFNGDAMHAAFSDSKKRCIGIEVAERDCFGTDHATIGFWLAEHWMLPKSLCLAIRYHHDASTVQSEPLVPLVHVGEAMSNALDLFGDPQNHVTKLSASAFKKLGLIWGSAERPEFGPLFGRMEARSRHANELMRQAG